ncbi:MAG: hypothetical protein ABW096_19305 [Candidatus Thiodiazotropha sp.]
MATLDSATRRLWAKAQYRASDMGFAPDCKDLVENLVREAAHRLETDGLLSDDDQLAIAEANVERFISEMIIQARNRGYNELHEDTFAAAMNKLCPLWPIC